MSELENESLPQNCLLSCFFSFVSFGNRGRLCYGCHRRDSSEFRKSCPDLLIDSLPLTARCRRHPLYSKVILQRFDQFLISDEKSIHSASAYTDTVINLMTNNDKEFRLRLLISGPSSSEFIMFNELALISRIFYQNSITDTKTIEWSMNKIIIENENLFTFLPMDTI